MGVDDGWHTRVNGKGDSRAMQLLMVRPRKGKLRVSQAGMSQARNEQAARRRRVHLHCLLQCDAMPN